MALLTQLPLVVVALRVQALHLREQLVLKEVMALIQHLALLLLRVVVEAVLVMVVRLHQNGTEKMAVQVAVLVGEKLLLEQQWVLAIRQINRLLEVTALLRLHIRVLTAV